MKQRQFLIGGHAFPVPAAAPGLHIVATPIGNLADMTVRALTVLAGVDTVAAEDTRHSGRLLQHYGIAADLQRYDEHSAAVQGPKLLAWLEGGAAIALVSDAGTPLISDPGYRLVRAARDAGVMVHAVPGASALTGALSVAGLPTDAVLFAGFLPTKAGARGKRLDELSSVRATLVFYEAPHRLTNLLAALGAAFPKRECVVVRELTKRFEEVQRGTPAELAQHFDGAVKGELVVLVGPPAEGAAETDPATLDAMLTEALHTMGVSAAAATVAKATGAERRALYKRATELKHAPDIEE